MKPSGHVPNHAGDLSRAKGHLRAAVAKRRGRPPAAPFLLHGRSAALSPKALDGGRSAAALPRSGGVPALHLAKRAFACSFALGASSCRCRRRRRCRQKLLPSPKTKFLRNLRTDNQRIDNRALEQTTKHVAREPAKARHASRKGCGSECRQKKVGLDRLGGEL